MIANRMEYTKLWPIPELEASHAPPGGEPSSSTIKDSLGDDVDDKEARS